MLLNTKSAGDIVRRMNRAKERAKRGDAPLQTIVVHVPPELVRRIKAASLARRLRRELMGKPYQQLLPPDYIATVLMWHVGFRDDEQRAKEMVKVCKLVRRDLKQLKRGG